MKEKIYKKLPHIFQCLLISVFNFLAYKQRYGRDYYVFLKQFKKNRGLSVNSLKDFQEKRLRCFIKESISKSDFYKDYIFNDVKDFYNFPIIGKESLRKNIENVYTIKRNKGILSKTGGTTGKSLEVLFSKENMQERFAMLDDFRNRYGYELGKRTAWFSGKDLLTEIDIEKKRFWKTDYFYNVRYYSTFHIKEEYLKSYVNNLIDFQPEYIVGFPSTMLEIAKYALKAGYVYPDGITKAIFPTAETITLEMRRVIEEFFKCKMYNQYASSEGAPFIFECAKGNLHLELQSGVFEVLDTDNKPAKSGRLVVTSFTTEGTPLIRYDIGDSISLSDVSEHCGCGNNNPLVEEILGRVDDFIYSPENGKINLGNVSNTLKDTKGIIRFQVLQNELNSIEILLETDKEVFNKNIENKFLQNWHDRVGNNMEINLIYVSDIEVEKSGKFRIVKNNIKHLI